MLPVFGTTDQISGHHRHGHAAPARRAQLARFAELCAGNAEALLAALKFCADHGIGSFRILSPILPVKTHSTVGYRVEELPGADGIVAQLRRVGEFARAHGIRAGLHPDQFAVLNSPDENIVARSIADIESQAEIAEWTNADYKRTKNYLS